MRFSATQTQLLKIFLSFVFTTLCSFVCAQENATQTVDSTTTFSFDLDSTSFVVRTDVLDLLSTLIEENNFKLTFGLEFILSKKYSIRLQARTEFASERFLSTTEFRSGPEIIKYFSENKDGSFYFGVFLEYLMYKHLKYERNLTSIKVDNFFSPGITSGYCYSAAKHLIVEPTLRIGYGDIFDDTPMNVRIGLFVGYSF